MTLIRRNIISAAILAATSLFFACATDQAVQNAEPISQAQPPPNPAPYIIQPGDGLDIKFFYNPELNESVTVRPDGKISLQLVDEVQASGLTPSQLDGILTQRYSGELKEPVITVIVRSFIGQRVYVGGEVNSQGIIELTTGMTALQAVINAGGFKETALPQGAIIIRKGPDNRPIPMRVDLTKALYGNSPGSETRLRPYDIVYVPKSAIAKANKFVNQYIEKLLLFRGVSFGFSYEIRGNTD